MSSFSSTKLVFDGENRRFPLPENPSLEALMQSVTKAFEAKLGANAALHLEYTDDEEDLITVSSDAEFQEALSVFREQAAKIPKFTVIQGNHTEARPPTTTANHSSSNAVHTGVCCDKCNMNPIIGFRYKCAVRKDYDLCELCEAQDESPYPYLKIKNPEQAPTFIQIGLRSDSGSQSQDFAQINAVSGNYADVSVNKPNPIGFLTNVLEAVNKVAHNERERARRDRIKRPSQPSTKPKSSEESRSGPAAEPTAQPACPPTEVLQSSPPEMNLVQLQCVTSVHKDGPYFMVRDKDTVYFRPAGSANSDGHLFMRRNGSVGIDAPKTHCCASWQIIEKENGTVSFKNKGIGLMLASVNGNLVGMQSTSSVPCSSFHLEFLPKPAVFEPFQPPAPTKFNPEAAATTPQPAVIDPFQPKPTPLSTKPTPARTKFNPEAPPTPPYQEQKVQPKPAAPTDDHTEAPPKFDASLNSRLCAKFVSDATIPDGCALPARAKIQKTWRLRNECDIPFPSGCRLECIGGDHMGGPIDGVQVPVIQPWEEFNVTVPLLVPETLGPHKSLWRLRSPSGQHFGDQLWVSLISSASGGPPQVPQQLHLPVPNGTRQPPTVQEPSPSGPPGDWDVLLDAELAEMCAESMKEGASPQFSSQNPFLQEPAGTHPQNPLFDATKPQEVDVPQKWRPAVDALFQMGFGDRERSVAALDKWATPENWQDRLNAVINDLVQN